MGFLQPRRLPGGRKAVVYAVLVHATLIALITVGARWQSRPVSAPAVIQAQVITDAESRREVERLKREDSERRQEQTRQAEQKRREDDSRRQAEADKKRKEDDSRRLLEAEMKRKEDDKRRQAEADKKRKEEEARQSELRRKKEVEERRKAAESSLQEQLAREEKDRAAAKVRAEQAARAQSELSRVEGLIRQKVERNWVRPAGWSQGMECIVRVRLIPTGEVISATVARSSGSPAFDRSVENAVYKASPLPLPEDKGLFEHFRELELRFRPEGQG